MFYNRKTELRRLKQALGRARKQLIVLYGRRRCGKSTLLRQIVRKKDVYFLATEVNQALQRKALANALANKIPGITQTNFSDWTEFFRFVNQVTRERFTLILDEFPYMVTAEPALPSIINLYVDYRSDLNFDLILCGSSQQMMKGAVLSGSAPLFGRADEIMKIAPLEAGWLPVHLPELHTVDLIREFAVWGGIPRYWELRDRYSSRAEAIRAMILEPTGVLRDEPNRLLLDDMRQLLQALSLLTAIAQGANRLSEIGGRLQRPATDLSRPLKRLIELGYVKKEVPYGVNEKKSKTTLYKVSDNFMRFYFHLAYPEFSSITSSDIERSLLTVEAKLDQFVGEEWENLCRRAISSLPSLAGKFRQVGRWWGTGTNRQSFEVDFVAESLDEKQLLIGECKWSDVKNPDRLRQQLIERAKALPFYRGQEVVPVLAARSFLHSPDCIGITPEVVLDLLKD